MKFNKILLAAAMASVLTVSTTSCADDYKDLNQKPSDVTKVDPKGLMAQAVIKFNPNPYLLWFYNVNYMTRWSQMACPTGSFTDSFTEMAECGDQGSQYVATLRYRNEIRNYIDNSGEEKMRGYEAVCTVLSVYLGIFDSDVYGALPYTEACRYKFDGILTPKYDLMPDLYATWLKELDESIAIFQRSDIENNPGQDVVYAGDWAKWAKLANSLKLKIAVRLLVQDKAQAFSIAQAVAGSSAGYIDDMGDDFYFCKATKANSGDNDAVYGTGNGLASPGLSKNVADFLIGSLDPRIRFIYDKNNLNSKVIQGFIDAGTFDKLPDCIKDVVIRDEQGNFKAWGGLGEPWVRYQGLPVVLNGNINKAYAKYFNYGTDYNLTVDEATKTYYPFSTYSEEIRRGRCTFTVPTLGKKVIQDTDPNPLYNMYMTAAEVNLYLAEFKALGANLPQDVEYYYNRGVRFSVQTYDKLARDNKIPYYGTTYGYDENEKVIDLQPGEIDKMMATNNVKLSAGNQLEKIYLQELIHFSLMPDDQFVTARRSGYTKIGSNLLPFVKFNNIVLEAIPRRFEIGALSPTDKMRDLKEEAYKAQGFNTIGSGHSGAAFNLSGSALNTERVWQDLGAPQWGTPAK